MTFIASVGWIGSRVQGAFLVQFDVEKEEPMRGLNGFCIPCAVGQAGELVFRIQDEGTSRFEGYSDESSTNKKIVSNVFVAGDKFFRSGDLLRQVLFDHGIF